MKLLSHKHLILVMMLLVSSCTTIGPTISYHNWNCGTGITAETKQGTCTLKQEYMSEYTYVGSVQPVNYSEAVPDGKGIITNTSTGAKIETTYSLGNLKKAKQKYSDGSVFEGQMSNLFTRIYGELKTSEYTFNGSFNASSMTKGKITWKNKNSFDGTFVDDKPSIGKFSYYSLGCSSPVVYDGTYVSSDNIFITLDTSKPYTIEHPVAKISGKYSKNLDFNFTIDGIADSTISDYKSDVFFSNLNIIKSITTNESFLKLNEVDLSVSESSLIWNDINDCNSYPEFVSKDKFLESTDARYIIVDEDLTFDKTSIADFGFEVANKIYVDELNSQYLIFSIKNRDYSRKVLSKNNYTSKYVSGQREVYNPNYDTASANVYDAQNRLAQARADEARQEPTENCADNIWACILVESLKAAPVATAKTNYDNALRTLENTPRTLIQDIISEYEVEKLEIEASKSLLGELAFVDTGREQIYTIDYPIELSKTFEVINSPVAETDTNKKRLLDGTSEENEVDDWMNKKIAINKNINNLLNQLMVPNNLKNKNKNVLISYLDKFNSIKPIDIEDINSSQNKILIKTDDYVIEDSILIVDTLGGMGTGFYITKEYVITNQHVVEESGFVTLRDFYDNSFTGKVIATDVATDLALISVTDYQIPLELDNQCSVRRRENVFTVGHPKGFEYSTTRGIVSAIRDMPQPFYTAVGNKKYIQIDAAISSGNSGGPLFNSLEKVIGVNTWGRTDGQSLNFAIHCSEVKDFLSDNGVYLD